MGVDPLQKDKINQTSLYYAARESKYNCCKYFVEYGVPLNEKDMYMQTPIYYAAREGSNNIINLFLDNNADINLEDKYGQICIYYAIKNGHESTVQLLLDKGADKSKVDKKKLSLYLFALKQNKPTIAEILANNNVPIDSNESNNKKSLNKKRQKKENKTDCSVYSNNNTVNNQENRIKNFILVKFTNEGKVRLNSEEISDFFKTNPMLHSIMTDKEKLVKLEEDSDNRLKDTEGWEKVAKKVLNILWKIKESSIFHKPVDPIEFNIPDYFNIVKNPMDFSTIKKRLNLGLYVNFKEFDDDIKLVFYNCFLYNGDKSYIGSMCIKVKEEYENLYQQNNLELF